MSRYISFVYISQRHFSFFRLKFMHHVDLVASQDIYIEKIPYSLVLSFFLIFYSHPHFLDLHRSGGGYFLCVSRSHIEFVNVLYTVLWSPAADDYHGRKIICNQRILKYDGFN